MRETGSAQSQLIKVDCWACANDPIGPLQTSQDGSRTLIGPAHFATVAQSHVHQHNFLVLHNTVDSYSGIVFRCSAMHAHLKSHLNLHRPSGGVVEFACIRAFKNLFFSNTFLCVAASVGECALCLLLSCSQPPWRPTMKILLAGVVCPFACNWLLCGMQTLARGNSLEWL